MQKIIFDTDPGIDDVMALLFAEASPAIDVIGITTGRGNAEVDITTRNALYVAERFDIPAPVFRGAAAALEVADDDPPAFVHGEDGLGNTSPDEPTREVSSMPADEYIVDAVRRYPGEITLVAIGRLTNLALALQRDPGIVDAVKQVVVMGGALDINGHAGNITPHAEANIYGDPHAASIVFGADWPVVMVGLDVTMPVMMDTPRMLRIRDSAGDAGQYLYDISRFYQKFYEEQAGVAGFPVHDSSALAYVIDRTLFETRAGVIDVALAGEHIGQTRLAHDAKDLAKDRFAGKPQQLACVGVDAERLLDLYESLLIKEFG
ncbi:MAG: nucleoside hydrolase [Woeseiaceae bacterium]